MKYDIELNRGIEIVKKFCNLAIELDTEIYLQQGRFVVDAKSIMGVFSLNLLEPMAMEIEEMTDAAEKFVAKLTELNIICKGEK